MAKRKLRTNEEKQAIVRQIEKEIRGGLFPDHKAAFKHFKIADSQFYQWRKKFPLLPRQEEDTSTFQIQDVMQGHINRALASNKTTKTSSKVFSDLRVQLARDVVTLLTKILNV